MKVALTVFWTVPKIYGTAEFLIIPHKYQERGSPQSLVVVASTPEQARTFLDEVNWGQEEQNGFTVLIAPAMKPPENLTFVDRRVPPCPFMDYHLGPKILDKRRHVPPAK